MQAIMASLEASGAMAPPDGEAGGEVRDDESRAHGTEAPVAGLVDGDLPAVPADASPSVDDGDDDEDALLNEAIRLSLESEATRKVEGAPQNGSVDVS